MNKPNVFFVGYPKTGSTSLYNYLQDNKEIAINKIKEPNFFSTDIKEEIKKYHSNYRENRYFKIKSETEYIKLFSSDKKIVTDFSTSHIISEDAAKNIYTFNPNAKIIITLREPTSFLESLYYHLFWGNNETLSSFRKAIEAEKRRKKNQNSIPKKCEYPSKLYYSKYINYQIHIKNYLKYFNSEKILILFTEDLKKDLKKELIKIYYFLNVESFILPKNSKKYNLRKNIRFKLLYKLFSKNKLFVKLYQKLPFFITCHFFTDKKEDNSEYKLILKKKLKKEVEELQTFLLENELIDKNTNIVKLWGYDDINHKKNQNE